MEATALFPFSMLEPDQTMFQKGMSSAGPVSAVDLLNTADSHEIWAGAWSWSMVVAQVHDERGGAGDAVDAVEQASIVEAWNVAA